MFRSRRSVLVIGSAHLDILGHFTGEDNLLDKPGRVTFSIGGTAYNIAVNLGISRIRASLFTYLPSNSAISKVVLTKLVQNNVRLRNVQLQDSLNGRQIGDGGFVALRNDDANELLAAVSYSAIGDSTFTDSDKDAGRLRRSIRAATVVVADCNLRADSLAAVLKISSKYRKPVIVAGVSEAKARRLAAIGQLPAAEFASVFVINKDELKGLLERTENSHLLEVEEGFEELFVTGGKTLENLSREVCRTHNSKTILVTSENGFLIFFDTGQAKYMPIERVAAREIENEIGAGDSVTASVADFFSEFRSNGIAFDFSNVDHCERFKQKVQKNIRRALAAKGATPNSAFSFNMSDLGDDSLPRTFYSRLRPVIFWPTRELIWPLTIAFLGGSLVTLTSPWMSKSLASIIPWSSIF